MKNTKPKNVNYGCFDGLGNEIKMETEFKQS